MIRLCIIGNSHVAALKHGAQEFCARQPDISLGFFAARSNKTGDLELREGRYAPRTEALADQIALTSEGKREIDPQDWDAFLVYGFGSRPHSGDFATGLSRSFRRAIFAERMAQSLLPRHLSALRALSNAPLFAALTPLHAPSQSARRRRLLRHPEEVALVQATICDPHGAALVPQPEATVFKGLYTRPEYSIGSAPLDDADTARAPAHDKAETRHMNRAYGLLWLECFAPMLRASLAQGSARARAG